MCYKYINPTLNKCDLKVLTIEEKPFVYARRVYDETDCTSEEIFCPHYNSSDDPGKQLFLFN